MEQPVKKLRSSRFKIQLKIFVVLFLITEIVMRLFGLKAGTLIDDFKSEDKPVYQARFYCDSDGINRILPDAENLMSGTVINRQGFRGNYDFTSEAIDSIRKNTKKEVIMMIGDSFVEGCCADSVSNSFPDLLNKSGKYEILNFGVAGTDPVQYLLIAKRYIPQLKPNRVVVVVYLGNDVLRYLRVPSPGIPLTFPFKKNKWIFSVAPNHLSQKVNYIFKDHNEAYNFYITHYTLNGQNRNFFEKIISFSALFSKTYLFLEHSVARLKLRKQKPYLALDEKMLTHIFLKEIRNICHKSQIPLVFVAIPSPAEASEGEDLKSKYEKLFEDIPWFIPYDFRKKDYDGSGKGNHFNNRGHKRYADFMKDVLEKTKTGNN